MKYLKILPVIGLFSMILISCGGKKSKLGKLIPKEAGVVVVINQKSILSKLPWEEIKKTYLYNHLMADSSISASSKTFLTDPAKTGIDMDADIIAFSLSAESEQMVMEGSVKDNAVFTDFVKTMHPHAAVSKEGDMDIIKTDHAVMGWNTERFVMVSDMSHNFHRNDSLHDSLKTPALPKTAENLLTVCKNVFALSADNSLSGNERFADLESEQGDIHYWMNISQLAKGAMKGMQGGMMGMIKLDKFLDDNVTTGTINFQDGKILGTHKQYFSKELSDILKKGDGDMNTDMIKRLPPNVAAIFSFHFTPGNLLEIIKLTGLDGFINLFMAQKGLNLDDVAKATKGDIVISVSDVRMTDDTSNLKGSKDSASKYYPKPDATLLFAIAIGDADAFNKLLGLGNEMKKDLTEKKTFQRKDDKYFVFSNSAEAMNKYFSGTTSEPGYLNEIKDHPLGGFVDIQMILKALQAEITKDSMGKVYYARNISMWDNIYFKGGEYKDGGLVHTVEVNLVDKTTNSLKQLNAYLDDNVKMMIENKKMHKEEWKKNKANMKKGDSTFIPKPKPPIKKRK